MKLLVIAPSSTEEVGRIGMPYFLLDPDTGETLCSHFCSGPDYAKGDLYDNRPERKEQFLKRWGEVEVKFIDEAGITDEQMMKKNKEWYDSLPEDQKKKNA